jgi:hypothetical protein
MHLARWYVPPHTYNNNKMEPKDISFFQLLRLFWPIHYRQLHSSYVARSSYIMKQKNSLGPSHRNPMHLTRWYVPPHTYQYNKREPKIMSFCQWLASFWPIHHRQLHSYIARLSYIMEPSNSGSPSARNAMNLNRWYVPSHISVQ